MTPRSAKRGPGVVDELKRHPKTDRADYPVGNCVSITVVEAVAREEILNLTGGEPGTKYSPDECSG